MPGGRPAGTLLGLFLFLGLINKAGYPHKIKNVTKYLTAPLKSRVPMDPIHLKYMDDMTLLEAIHLKNNLVQEPNLFKNIRVRNSI